LSYTIRTNKVDLVDASHMNTAMAEIVAINNRLLNMIDSDGSIASGSSYPSPALASQGFWRTDLNQFAIFSGLAWFPIGSKTGVPNKMQAFTASGTWTRPAGVNNVYVKVWGAGGGGGGSGNITGAAGGGGGGGYCEAYIAVTGNVTVTIGAGGAGGVGGSSDGSTGGNSSFAGSTTPTANGGAGGAASGNGGASGAGGSFSNADLGVTGSRGVIQGASSGLTISVGGDGGGSVGFNGCPVHSGGATAPNAPVGSIGGGGGGALLNASGTGGNGTDGMVEVYWVE
jgi:hypothetical protein